MDPSEPIQLAEDQAPVFRPQGGHGRVGDKFGQADRLEAQEDVWGHVRVCGDAIPELRVAILYEVQVAQALRMASVGVP